jgi:hypothetical protein
VNLINGASPCNVYWQVGSSATLGTTTAFKGNLMASSSISLNANASVIGRMLARNGQASLIDDVLDASGCGANTIVPAGQTVPGAAALAGGALAAPAAARTSAGSSSPSTATAAPAPPARRTRRRSRARPRAATGSAPA